MADNFNMASHEAEKMIRSFIQNRMIELDITRYRLQKMTGINRSTIGRWLDGETSISVNNYLKILGALEIRQCLIPSGDDDTEM